MAAVAALNQLQKGSSYLTTTNEQLIRAYLDAVAAWKLDDASAGNLIGVEAHSLREWHEGQLTEPSEEFLARMSMVA